MRKVAVALTVVLALGACAQGGGGPGEFGANKTTAGGILGGVGGAVAGAQFGKGTGQLAATALGTILGAFVGSSAGASLDRADANYANQAGHRAFETAPSGQSVAWANPDNGHRGTITPAPAYQTSSGQYCREYSQTVVVGGQQQQSYGTACRQPDGSWRIVN